MKRAFLLSVSLYLCVGLAADSYAQEALPVDQLMQDGSQAYLRGDFEQAVEQWTEAAEVYEKSSARREQIDVERRIDPITIRREIPILETSLQIFVHKIDEIGRIT